VHRASVQLRILKFPLRVLYKCLLVEVYRAQKKTYRASQPEVSRYTLDDSSGYACGGQSVLIYLLPLTPTGVAVVAIAANYLWPILNTPRYTVTLLMTY